MGNHFREIRSKSSFSTRQYVTPYAVWRQYVVPYDDGERVKWQCVLIRCTNGYLCLINFVDYDFAWKSFHGFLSISILLWWFLLSSDGKLNVRRGLRKMILNYLYVNIDSIYKAIHFWNNIFYWYYWLWLTSFGI